MSEYRCSQCGERYTHNEHMALESVKVEGPDPTKDYGKETVCECGARFHSDKWRLFEELEIGGEEFEVSTVALTIPHGPNHNQWFETCVFHSGGSKVTDRYETQEEAEAGHEKRVEQLKESDFGFKPTGKQIEFNE